MRFRVSASATTVAVITLQCVAQTATFENIGELPGGIDFTVGHGISRDGSTIAALSSSYFAYYGEAAYRRGDSDLIAIGALPTHQESNAAGVSATGTWIVGESVRQNEYTEAFRWSEDTGMIGLGDLPGGDRSSIARAVSRDGRVVVGGASTELDGKSVGAPFRWTPEGGMQHLTGSAVSGNASDVTPDGSVIVGGVADLHGVSKPFRWTAAGGLVTFDDLPGGRDSAGARAVSSNGRWLVGTGSSVSDTGRRESQAARWNEFGEVEGLGFLPGEDLFGSGRYSYAYDVSDDGRIVVGVAYTSGYDNSEHAVLWTPEWGFRTIESVLLDYGVDIHAEGWLRLEAAIGISGDGRTISGYGSIQGLGTQGWVVTLPVPAPTTVAPLAALGLAAARRRR